MSLDTMEVLLEINLRQSMKMVKEKKGIIAGCC